MDEDCVNESTFIWNLIVITNPVLKHPHLGFIFTFLAFWCNFISLTCDNVTVKLEKLGTCEFRYEEPLGFCIYDPTVKVKVIPVKVI